MSCNLNTLFLSLKHYWCTKALSFFILSFPFFSNNKPKRNPKNWSKLKFILLLSACNSSRLTFEESKSINFDLIIIGPKTLRYHFGCDENNEKFQWNKIKIKINTTIHTQHTLYLGPAIVRINLFVRSIATISDIKMVSGADATDVLVLPNHNAIVLKSHLDVPNLSTSQTHTHNKYIHTHTLHLI